MNGEVCYPIEDSLFIKHEWLNAGLPLLDLPEPEMPYMNPFFVGYIMKIRSFFVRFDEMIHGPEFSKEELYCCTVNFSAIFSCKKFLFWRGKNKNFSGANFEGK